MGRNFPEYDEQGFTLLEALVVGACVVILVALVMFLRG